MSASVPGVTVPGVSGADVSGAAGGQFKRLCAMPVVKGGATSLHRPAPEPRSSRILPLTLNARFRILYPTERQKRDNQACTDSKNQSPYSVIHINCL